MVVACGLLASCSAEEGPVGGPYAEEFAQALAEAPNDYQRAILADGVITAAEVMDACVDEWFGSLEGIYFLVFTNPNREDWNGLIAACLVRHGLVPEGFRGEDYAELFDVWAESYVSRISIPDDTAPLDGPITIQDMDKDLPDGWTCEGWCKLDDPPPYMELPGGATMGDPEAVACGIVPLR
jgi:hypothetical protein